MKKSILAFKEFIYHIIFFRRYVRLRKVEKLTKNAVVNQRVDKIIYMDLINKDMRKALRIDAHSKYIPDDIKNKEEVREMLNVRHGEQMKMLNITLTKDFKLV